MTCRTLNLKQNMPLNMFCLISGLLVSFYIVIAQRFDRTPAALHLQHVQNKKQ